MNIAFAGLRHGHIYALYDMAMTNKNFTVVGAFEDDALAKAQAEQRGVNINYRSYGDVLADKNCEVVALGGCFGDRGNMAIAALKAGKHVIADKPLCTSLFELDEIERLAKEKNLLVSCMFTMRYEKKITALKALYESGELGEINNVYFGGQHPLQYGRRPSWYYEDKKHGGTINDIAIHGIDVLSFAFGMKIKDVVGARSWNKFAHDEPQFNDSAQFMATAQNGAGILADVSYAIPDGVEFSHPCYWQFSIWGTKGTICFSLGEKQSYYYVAGDKQPRLLCETPIKTDYLDDFYNYASGKKDVVLTTKEVVASTRKALEIQKYSYS